MDSMTDPALHQLPVSLQNLHPRAFQSEPTNLTSHLASDFDPHNFQSYPAPSNVPQGYLDGQRLPHNSRPYAQSQARATAQVCQSQLNHHSDSRVSSSTQTPLRQSTKPNSTSFSDSNGNHYNVLDAEQQLSTHQDLNFLRPVSRLRPQERLSSTAQNGHAQDDSSGHFGSLKFVPDPPDLEKWRERLFNVDDTITLTQEEFHTYFPHIDNVYSHRSTQRYKRKPFVSHYWDCRLKGRPPGTPKSDDLTKKKRRRTARQRDLCDVKIKITEYFPAGADGLSRSDCGVNSDTINGTDGPGTMTFMLDVPAPPNSEDNPTQQFGVLTPNPNLPPGHPGATGATYYTIQRVNGNPGTNGSIDRSSDSGLTSRHKHTLEESDKVKKNSVQRWLLKEEKENKRKANATNVQTASASNPSVSSEASQPTLSRPAGLAPSTRKRHCEPADLILYANSFCPFTQRVWIALEVKQVPYQYVEITPSYMSGFVSVAGSGVEALHGQGSTMPQSLLEVNPQANIPCIRHGNWGCWESEVLMEYLEDLSIGHSLLPLGDPQLRAHCRLWADHINRKILPPFYALLLTPSSSGSSQSTSLHSMLTATLQGAITALVDASHVTGPFFLGPRISFVDVAFAPWIIRLSRVLKVYRGWPDPEVGSRWAAWVSAIEGDERVKSTVSDDGEYRGVYGAIAGEGMVKGAYERARAIAEIDFARRVVRQEGFGLGGDILGHIPVGQ